MAWRARFLGKVPAWESLSACLAEEGGILPQSGGWECWGELRWCLVFRELLLSPIPPSWRCRVVSSCQCISTPSLDFWGVGHSQEVLEGPNLHLLAPTQRLITDEESQAGAFDFRMGSHGREKNRGFPDWASSKSHWLDGGGASGKEGLQVTVRACQVEVDLQGGSEGVRHYLHRV